MIPFILKAGFTGCPKIRFPSLVEDPPLEEREGIKGRVIR
jgi:hypothetical protein